MKNKKAFTLVELSVVIIIISVILSAVLVSRSLINSAKVNAIYKEYISMSNAMNLFKDQFDCMAGDCTATQISTSDLNGKLHAACTTANATAGAGYLALGTGAIETAAKRSCVFYSLQLAGYIDNMSVPATSVLLATVQSAIATSVKGVNLPASQSNASNILWDYRTLTTTVVAAVANSITIPVEMGVAGTAGWAGNNIFVLRDSGGVDITIPTLATTTGGAGYAVSAKMSKTIDTKFDDGLPYSGSIVGGLAVADYNSATALTKCNTLSATATAAAKTATIINGAQTYLTSDGVSNGCLLTFLSNVSL